MKYTTQMKYTRVVALAAVAAVAALGNARAGDDESKPKHTSTSGSSAYTTTASSTDKHASKFLKEAMQDNQKEMAMVQVALTKAQNAELKSYAQQLRQDHTHLHSKLQSLAREHGIQAEQRVNEFREESERLQKLSGAEFDKEFVKAALKDHQKDIAKYQKAIEQVEANDVKQFAQQTLPKLRQHLNQTAQVARTVGIDSATISAYTREASGSVGGSTSTGESTDDSFHSTREAGAENQKGHGAHNLKEGDSSSSGSSTDR